MKKIREKSLALLGWFKKKTTHMTYPSPNSMSILLMEEILHQLMSRLSHYLPGFIHPRWFAWLLPSTVVKPTGHPRVCRCPHPGNAGLPRLLTLHQSGACSIWQDGIWELFFQSPKDHLTLQWKGLNLYSRGSGVLKIASFEGSGSLGRNNETASSFPCMKLVEQVVTFLPKV